MKIKKIIIGIVFMALGLNSSVHAAPGNVRFTVHNLSNNDNPSTGLTVADRRFYSVNESQVCVFCHSPHNAQPATPLWNKATRTDQTASFRMYTSSRSSLTDATRASSLPAGSPSLLCLSCHDGKTAVNVLHSASGGVAAPGPDYNTNDKMVDIGNVLAPLALQDFTFGYQATTNLGGTEADYYAGNNLTDDHPIGFSYTLAQSQSTSRLNNITLVGTNSSGAIKFFGGTDRMECSTCHDPHVNYNAAGGGNTALKPFLVMSNTGSALCLSCHNK